MRYFEFKDYVTFHIKLFKYFGYWTPDADDSDSYKFWYFYNKFRTKAWFLTLASQVTSFVLNIGDMNESTDIIYITVCCIVAFFKLLAIHDNLGAIKVLLMQLSDPLLTPKCRKHLQLCGDARSFHKKLFVLFMFLGGQITVSFAAIPLFSDGRLTVLPGWFPFDWKLSPYYELVYAYQSLMLLWICYLSSNADTFTVGLLMQIGLQCDYLCAVLDNMEDFHVEGGVLVSDGDGNGDVGRMKGGPEDFSRMMTENLVVCIKQHKFIERLAADVENIHRVSIFILSLGSTLVLCTALFQMTQITPGEDPAKFMMLVSILICLLIQQLMHCWFCNEIILKSEIIFAVAYNTPWVDCDLRFKKTLLNFLTQTIKPIEIKVGGLFSLSNNVFISIVRSSYSYFTILRTMQENSSTEN